LGSILLSSVKFSELTDPNIRNSCSTRARHAQVLLDKFLSELACLSYTPSDHKPLGKVREGTGNRLIEDNDDTYERTSRPN